MSNQFVIDALDFVRQAGSLHGSVPPFDLERLQDYLSSEVGKLVYSIDGMFDKQGRPILRIAITGIVNLKCQRCLEQLEHILDLKTDLLLARNEEELSRYDEDASVDIIMASNALDTLALVEDEVILSLPISPRHQDTVCQETMNGIYETLTKERPFAALASLKQPH
jgi:uncharacterized protein